MTFPISLFLTTISYGSIKSTYELQLSQPRDSKTTNYAINYNNSKAQFKIHLSTEINRKYHYQNHV